MPIYRRRIALGLTQAELANLIGVHRQTISNLERHLYVPNARHARALAEVLGGTMADYLEGRPFAVDVNLVDEARDLLERARYIEDETWKPPGDANSFFKWLIARMRATLAAYAKDPAHPDFEGLAGTRHDVELVGQFRLEYTGADELAVERRRWLSLIDHILGKT